jgi:hypothetical protein
MSASTSFSQISADKVLKACHAYLENRAARIEAETKTLIDAEMNRRFFPAATEKTARARCAEDLMYVRISGSFWANKIHDLHQLASISDGPIYVSAEDAYILREFWPYEQSTST